MSLRDTINEYLNYNANTGIFTWKIGRRGRAKVGTVAGTKHPKGYIRISLNHIDYLAHRLAWIAVNGEIHEDLVIDHINGDRSDNRIDNLRMVTGHQNANNRHSPLCTDRGLIGASFHKPSGKWVARIKINNRDKYLGIFDTSQEAHEMYMFAKQQKNSNATSTVELL